MQTKEEKRRYNRERYHAKKDEINARRKERMRDPEYRARQRAAGAEYLARNREEINARRRARYAANPEPVRVRNREFQASNRRRLAEYARQWRKQFPDKQREINKRWREENADYVQALNAKRRAAELQAIPRWADLDEIEAVYAKRPAGATVDHINPLRADWVCGLHVASNLQYLSPYENTSKGNRRLATHHFERKVYHSQYLCVTGLVVLSHE
jgi:hypothetical protein